MEVSEATGPKIFYRRLDAILSKIGKTKSDKNFFINILSALRKEFGKDLKIKKSYIYEERGTDYILIHSVNAGRKVKVRPSFSRDSRIVSMALIKRRAVITAPELIKEFEINGKKGISAIAVTTVHNPVRRWIFVFELDHEWVYEEIMLFLRAMRTALNYRLFSEMVGTDLERSEQIQKSLLP
ncbi:hypothetical protein J7K93_07660, partial [bacterium]|nr:hypothetical protein [bacterium]